MEKKLDYEKSIARLEEITALLEKGEVSLDDMIKLYAEGTEIASECSKALADAKVKITEITEGTNDDE